MIAPPVDEEVPSLFFVWGGESVTKIAEIGYIPSFSPDGEFPRDIPYLGQITGSPIVCGTQTATPSSDPAAEPE